MTGHRPAIGMESDRIIAANGQPGVAIDDDLLGERARNRQRRAGNNGEGQRKKRDGCPPFLLLPPCCGHSFGQGSADSRRLKKTL